MPLPNLPGETNNYFVAGAVRVQPLDARHEGELECHVEAEHLRPLQPPRLLDVQRSGVRRHPAGRADRRRQSRERVRATPPTSRPAAPTRSRRRLVADAHFGYVRMYTDVAHIGHRPEQGHGPARDSGPERPPRLRGRHAGLRFRHATRTSASPSSTCRTTANDDQYQTVVNVNWMKGKHNVRVGTDIYFQALNHIQPEIDAATTSARAAASASAAARRSSAAGRRATSTTRGASFLLGLPDQLGRLNLTVAPYTTRMRSYSFYVRDQWQVDQSADAVVRHALRVFPDADARRSRPRALQPRHQHDGDRRRRRRCRRISASRWRRGCSRRASA